MAHLLPSPSISYTGFKSTPEPHTHNVHSHPGSGLLGSTPALSLIQNVLHHAASLIFLIATRICSSFLQNAFLSLSKESSLDHDLKAAHVDLYQPAQPHRSSSPPSVPALLSLPLCSALVWTLPHSKPDQRLLILQNST